MEQEKTESPNVDLGQFKSAEELLKGYRQLQAEYTRCTQALKAQEHPTDDALYESVKANESVKNKIIGEYLSNITRSPLVSIEGTGVVSSPKKPKTVQEAGMAALQFFKKGV